MRLHKSRSLVATKPEIKRGPLKLFVTMTIECEFAAAHAGDSLYDGDKLIGTVTSGDYGHRTQKNIAYAFVSPDYSKNGTQLSIYLLGKHYPAVISEPCLYDPANELVKS